MLSSFATPQAIIKSVSTVNFLGGAAQNAMLAVENLALPNEYKNSHECVIEGISLISKQNLSLDVVLFGSGTTADTGVIDTDTFAYKFSFLQGDEVLDGTGTYYYCSASGLNINYRDLDAVANSAKIHATIVNRSAVAKIAGANGAIVLILFVRPVVFS